MSKAIVEQVGHPGRRESVCVVILCFEFNYSNVYVFTIVVSAMRKVSAVSTGNREDGLI